MNTRRHIIFRLFLINYFYCLWFQDMNNAKLFSDEAANIYERAISTLLKKNMLLYFAYADYEEVSPETSLLSQTP